MDISVDGLEAVQDLVITLMMIYRCHSDSTLRGAVFESIDITHGHEGLMFNSLF